MKILILYHSGAGNTKLVGELLYDELSPKYNIEIQAIEDMPEVAGLNNYDALILGFPTYHGLPSKSIYKYISKLDAFSEIKPVSIYTSCGWFPANSMRKLAILCSSKNMKPISYRSFRCIGSDGILLAPQLINFFNFDKNLYIKIQQFAKELEKIFCDPPYKKKKPPFKVYSLLNAINSYAGQSHRPTIYINKSQCIKCHACINKCNTGSWEEIPNAYPHFSKEDCESCYRCIHHCPTKALSLKKMKQPQLQLNDKFYKTYKEEIKEY